MSDGSMGVVSPRLVITVMVPPSLAPSICTGPLASGFCPPPVLPRLPASRLLSPLLLLPLSPPSPPPQAATDRRTAALSTAAGFFNRIYLAHLSVVSTTPAPTDRSAASSGIEGVSDGVAEEVQGEGEDGDRGHGHPQVE